MALVKYNNNSISAVTSTGLAEGSLVPIKTLTASSSATLSFVHGTDGVVLDSTYPIYKFEFINLHGSANSYQVLFQGSINSGSSYGVAITSTYFYANHYENDSSTSLTYNAGGDLANGTGFQRLILGGSGDNASKSSAGELSIYSPSSTTFVKHFMSTNVSRSDQDSSGSTPQNNNFLGGYFNTTSAINAIQFKMSTGNIDSGKIKLYGIKDS